MELESRKFLHSFNDQLIDIMQQDACFLTIYNSINSGALPLSIEINYDEKLQYIRELKKVVDKITNIVYKPHIISVEEDIVTRSEIAPKVTREGFHATMRDSRLWKQKNGEMTPEYVHTVENTDSIETYENKFITLLIKIIDRESKELINNLTPEKDSFEQYYQITGLTFASKSMVTDFNNIGEFYQDFLYKKADSLSESLSLLSKINKRIKNIKRTQFYRELENKCDNIQIMPTNILIHDNIYAYCYRFYKNNLQNLTDSESQDVFYYNYFTICLLKYLADNKMLKLHGKKKVRMEFSHDGRLVLKSIIFNRGLFVFSLNSEEGGHLLIETELARKAYANTMLIPVFKYNSESQRTVAAIENEEMHKIVVTNANFTDSYSDVLTYKYTNENRDYALKNFVGSLGLVFETESDQYDEICPICGRTTLFMRDSDYICNACHSRYQITSRFKSRLLWIKSLRRA